MSRYFADNVEPMAVSETSLPWNGSPVHAFRNLHSFFEARLGEASARYLPRSITLFFDPEIPQPAILCFLDAAAIHLDRELSVRKNRAAKFVNSHIFSAEELEVFLTDRTGMQPWALYYSKEGGLGIPEIGSGHQPFGQCGAIPCSTMRNHGVAWSCSDAGELKIWLATARMKGSDWNWDSDIGHESAHAAFAPVPLFVQPSTEFIDPMPLSKVRQVSDLEPAHVARICYLCSEIAVVAVRGEPRPTDTCLPVSDRDELFALLTFAGELAPGSGFDRALNSCTRVNGTVHPNEGIEIFEIAAPIMRLLPRLTTFTRSFCPPRFQKLQEEIAHL